MTKITRREFLEKSGRIVLGAGAGFVLGANLLNSSGCVSLEKSLKDYKNITKNWDPVYGPAVLYLSRYGGRADFKGHIFGGATPGVDYDVQGGTPLVPAANAFLHRIRYGRTDSLNVWLRHQVNVKYKTLYGHLSKNIIDKKYLEKDKIYSEGKYYHEYSQRLIKRNEIFALSGNSGLGPREHGGIQTYHLHFSLNYPDWSEKGKWLDPEKYGIDGGKPVFWDGKTNLDIKSNKRLNALEKTLGDFEGEIGTWQSEDNNLQELKGNLFEYYKLMGNTQGTKILDSKHFQDMRESLKRKTLEEKIYIPGTEPYSLMLKVLGYSVGEEQEIILTLPFIAPNLVGLYKEPIYEE